MKFVLSAIIVLGLITGISGCRKNSTDPGNSLLTHSTWKLYKITIDNPATAFVSDSVQSGYYLILRTNKTYFRNYYPYLYNETGDWNYSSISQQLVLTNIQPVLQGTFASATGQKQVYSVTELTSDDLILVQTDTTGGNMVHTTWELHTY